MGFLLETGKYKYKYIDGEYIKEEVGIGLQITNSFEKGLTFHKARNTFKCYNCGKDKPKNTRYLGGYYEQICVDCVIRWVEGSERTMHKIINMLNEKKIELLKNEKKWRKEMVLGAIEEMK